MPKSRKPQRTRLEKLQNSWMKASMEERDAFLAWIGRAASGSALPATAPVPIATGRYLTAEAAALIRARLQESGETLEDLNARLGLERGDRALARALALRACLRLSVVARLQAWLADGNRP